MITKTKMSVGTKKKINEAFMQMFYVDLQPFSMVEDTGFRNFVKALNPTFEIPSRKNVSKTLIPSAYANCMEDTKLAAGKIKSVCLTTDGWTSRTNESYLAVTAHFINDDFFLKKMLLDCSPFSPSHTADNLATYLRKITDEWGLSDKILLVVSDNAANITCAVKERLKWKHWGCFGHTLNLIVKDALKVVEQLIKKIRTIVAHFKRSSQATQKLMDCQKQCGINEPKKILQDVVTRWNSTFYMLERFVDLEQHIRSVLGLLDTHLTPLRIEEWEVVKELLLVLRPFENATKASSGDGYISASLVIVLINGLLGVCNTLRTKSLTKVAQEVLESLITGINNRLANIEYSQSLSLSTFLDPRFKTLAFDSPRAAETAKSLAINYVSNLIQNELQKNRPIPTEAEHTQTEETDTEESELSIWGTLSKKVCREADKQKGTSRSRAILEIQRYMEDEILDRKKDPIEWWRDRRYQYPYLSQIVQLKMCSVGTSVPCERLFSKAGLIIDEKRTRLSAHKAQQLLFLSVNYTFSKNA